LLLALLLAVYIATSLLVLRQASGLPYISDNVESYSNLVHATNLYTRGIGKSFGLTDETYGVRPDAPTVVYTHQGNFPRLYALLLYVLGLDTVEKQILATLATVGLATIVLAFITLAKLTTAGFAFIAVVLLQTNYVYVVQWHFDTFRVWHGLLLFSTLLLAYLSTTRTPLWRLFCVTNFLVCFYFETIFALFLSFLYLSVSTLVGKRDLADLLHRGWPLALGACLGSGVLVLQDVAYLGWEGFLNDLYFTYRIRNYSSSEYTNQLKLLEAFYRDNSVVYWYINIQDASGLLRPAALVRVHMSFIVALLPPVLIFIVFLNTACWCLRIAMPYSSSALLPARLISLVRSAKPMRASLKAPLVMLLLVIPVALLLEALWSFLNVADSSSQTNAYRVIVFAGCTSAALAIAVAAIKLACGRTSGYADLSFAKVLLTAALMAMAYGACAHYTAVFGPEAVDIWKVMPASTFAPQLYWLMSAISIVLALTIVFKVDRGRGVAQVPKEIRGIGMLLASCTVSYAVVFLFSPGYLFSAYFARWSIFPSFLWLLLVAATVYSLLRAGSLVGGDALRNTRDPVYGLSAGTFSSTRFWNSSSLIKLGLSWSGGAVGLLMLAIYGATQLSLVKALPPDHYSFLPLLGMAPYRGKSFVMDNYAAPVTTYTGEWAYFDPQFPARELLLESDGFKVRRDMRHLWSRDQLENAAYKKPDYFLCMRPQTPINDAILKNIRGERFGCSNYPIAIHALAGADEVFAHRIQDWDDARDSWMIIKLDWTYPPHLRDDPATGKWLEVSGKRRGGRTELKVSYQYAHQDGLPEQRSIIRVYQSPRASSCGLDHHNRVVVASSEGGSSITLPPEIRGTIVVSVTPMAANKYGAEYFSEEITIPGSDLEQLGHCSYRNAPTNVLNALAQIQAGYVSASWNAVDYATDYFVELRKNKGSWFSADVVSLPQLSLELPDAEGGYEMRVLPCNGRVCGGYSRPTKIMYAPPRR